MKIVGNSLFQKAANSALILNYLRTHTSCSRQQMAEKLGLQPSTVSYIVNRLIKAKLVEEIKAPVPKTKGSGRRPIQVQLIPEFGYVIGLDLQVDYYCTVVCDVSGRVLKSSKKEYISGKHDFKSLLIQSVEDVRKTLDPHIPVLGMGLAIPGVVNRQTSFVKDSWTHNLKNSSLLEFLDETFPFPVVIENDANCCAQNILWNHPDNESDSFIYLLSRFHQRNMVPENLPSIGVGLGLVLNGELYNGVSDEAGEYQSILYTKERQLKWQLSLSEEEMDRALVDSDVQKDILEELMGNMTLILKILNPRALYIGGDLASNSEEIWNILRSEFSENLYALEKKNCTMKVVNDGVYDPARGAAACMLSELYAIPQVGNGQQDKKKWNTLLSNVVEVNP
ncbi:MULTISPECIES: ROK family transcriptional regulator [unclassified Oceanispirochaeta]|uniref:ROK family transcriptional regulator n=1 Tax=unclassified Oceanispirochaeta TaxID=2635722 RepID=UPI000E09D187|nr:MULTISPECIES: ROK family transcriptional regulator [unclassified Oceanispirochaeta]MBF9017880.1 ROK family transcriptional regulator [Oceanispirochaeta sp. M2]NPD74391.1 ROK family transcriptional regulator [Oceanispirochaeta sp. M1]RDG29776.1 ROK family transcriptional regulator [Oceanispirochaeta sp. M1]